MKFTSQGINKPSKKFSPASSASPLKTTCIVSAIATLMLGSAHAFADTPINFSRIEQVQPSVAASNSAVPSPVIANNVRGGMLYNSNYTTVLTVGAYESGTLTQESNITLANDASYNNVGIEDNAKMTLYNNAKVKGLVFIRNNGTLTLHNSSTASGVNMVANGRMTMNDNATAANTIINENATLTLTGTTTANNTNMTSGTIFLKGSGIANDSVVSGSGNIYMSNTAKMNDTTFSGTGIFIVRENAIARGTRLNGTMAVDGAEISNTTISSAGSLSMTGASRANKTVLNGGMMLLAATSQATNTTISSGSMALIGNSVATNTTITGGNFNLSEMGRANQTTINGGNMTIGDSANANITKIIGGVMNVLGNATAADTQVGANGQFNLSSNGMSKKANVSGLMNVTGNATAISTTVSSGGKLSIDAGSNVTNTHIEKDGFLLLAKGARLTDINISNGGLMTLAGNATLAGDVTINGVTRFTTPATGASFSVLNINGNLNGNGTYYLNTHTATNKGDLIKITGQVKGNNTIVVADTGLEPTVPGNKTSLVHAGENSPGNFALQGGTVDIGAFRYEMAKEDNDWVLRRSASGSGVTLSGPGVLMSAGGNITISDANGTTTYSSTGVTKSPRIKSDNGAAAPFSAQSLSKVANAAVASHSATSVALVAQMNSLVKRLGELRMGKDDGGIWTRAYYKDQQLDTGYSRAFDQKISGSEFGLDYAYKLGDDKMYVGGLLGLGQADQDFKEGSKGKVKSFAAGAYASFIASNGFYADAVFKYSRFNNQLNLVSNVGENVNAEHKNTAYMLNLEIGKRIDLSANWFVEPQLELMATQINGTEYTASNGTVIKQGNMRSLQSRLGGLVGHNFKMDNGNHLQSYIKASWINEHEGKSEVSVNGNTLQSGLPGSRAEIGVGMIVQAADKHKFHVDLEYTKGKDLTQPFAVNVGYRYLW